MGVDFNCVRAAARLRGTRVLPRIFGEFLRRPALRDERRLCAYGRMHAAALLPQLVPAALPVRVRDIQSGGGITMGTAPRLSQSTSSAHAVGDFSAEVVTGLSLGGQKELPSKYLYDEVG